MSYDFSHLSPQDTKTAMRLVHRIEDITRDIDLCSSDTCKSYLGHYLLLTKNLLDLYLDPIRYKTWFESLKRGD